MQNETKTVKGFKAMHHDMTCRGFQFEVGKTYKHDGKVIPCLSGFHFCENIVHIDSYYTYACRIFEVEASGTVIYDGDKIVTDTLTIVKEIDYADFANHIYPWVQAVVAHNGFGLDVLVNHELRNIRKEVARHGYGLDKLVYDSEPDVRIQVAKHGYGLDKLVHDEYWGVRLEVARHGYGLDELVNDIDVDVRYLALKKSQELKND